MQQTLGVGLHLRHVSIILMVVCTVGASMFQRQPRVLQGHWAG